MKLTSYSRRHDPDDTPIRRSDGGWETLGSLRDEFPTPVHCNCRPGSPDSCELCEHYDDDEETT